MEWYILPAAVLSTWHSFQRRSWGLRGMVAVQSWNGACHVCASTLSNQSVPRTNPPAVPDYLKQQTIEHKVWCALLSWQPRH